MMINKIKSNNAELIAKIKFNKKTILSCLPNEKIINSDKKKNYRFLKIIY